MPTPTTEPVALDASLHLLADHLLDALEAGTIQPSLVRVNTPDADGFDLELAHLNRRHPTQLLMGTTAPARIHALGIAAHGWAYPIHRRGAPSPHSQRSPVSVVTMLTRSGESIHRLRTDDASTQELHDASGVGGEQVDLLRRALDLPTDPPPDSLSALMGIRWMEALLDHDVRSAPQANALWGATCLDHRAITWAEHRLAVARGQAVEEALTPAEADWLDDGAFARFLLSRCRPATALRREIDAHLPIEVRRFVHDHLIELDLVDAVWPDGPVPPRAA